MTWRGASTRVLNILQQISLLSRVQAAPSTFGTVRKAAAVSLPRRRIAEYHVGVERNIYGGSIPVRRLHSEVQARTDNHETHEYEKEKMSSEGGGTLKTFEERARELKSTSKSGVQSMTEEGGETAASVKDKLADTAENATEKASKVVQQDKDDASDAVSSATKTGKSAVGTVKEQASKEADTAKDMFKDFPEKMSETAAGLSEVGKEGAKAVKRDASKIAEKIGLKSSDSQ